MFVLAKEEDRTRIGAIDSFPLSALPLAHYGVDLLVLLLLVFVSSTLFGEINGAEISKKKNDLSGPKRLFVFGDSYADTGNLKKNSSQPGSWSYPYGITFPGQPSGRFSDGHISIDFLAKLLGIKLPITYRLKDKVDKERLQYGMNFAYGGTGVFDTKTPNFNMTTQIDYFEHLVGDVYSQSDLSSSLAHVSVAGNDYSNFLLSGNAILALPKFIQKVVDQTEVNLRRIYTLGVKKIAIPSLQPLGCIPSFVKSNLTPGQCNPFVNLLVAGHNKLLHLVVEKLNKETNHTTFIIFDYNNAFSTVFKNKGVNPGSMMFKTPYEECCGGGGACSVVDAKGKKNYTLCDDPKSAFFWDGLHPTQEGWRAVYSVLAKSITASVTKA